jgi:GxxExxY protein
MLEHEELSSQIIAAAITVHKELGPGFIESIYEEALAAEFDFLHLPYRRQHPVKVLYRHRSVGEHRLDFLVGGQIVVELKAVQALDNIHFAIVRSYLKATKLQAGLLFNFAAMPLTIKRVGREEAGRIRSVPDFLSSKLHEH